MRYMLVKIIRFYQIIISPLFGPSCRFHPSCSSYAQGAISEHGILAGGWLAIRRLGKCHPWHPGGFDPVPENTSKKSVTPRHG